MRILFLASRSPFPAIGGDKLRVDRMLRYLAARHEVTLLSFVESDEEREAAMAHAGHLARIRALTLPRRVSFRRTAQALLTTDDPLQVHYYRDRAMRAAVQEELGQGEVQVVLAHLVRMAQYALPRQRPRVIVDLQDALSLTYSRAARRMELGPWCAISRAEGPRVERYESWVVSQADASLVVSDVDRNWLGRRGDTARIHLVRNGVDSVAFTPRAGGWDPDRVCLLGNMRTAANQDMAVHFARDVFPRLLKLRPAARFHVVGTQPAWAVRRLHDGQRVFVTGEVRDVLSQLQASAVSVCPMRLGAGVQNKVLESMAAGVPVVATPMGMEGVPALHGVHALLAEDPDGLARQVARLMADEGLRRSIAASARALVLEQFGWEHCLSPLEAILRGPVEVTHG